MQRVVFSMPRNQPSIATLSKSLKALAMNNKSELTNTEVTATKRSTRKTSKPSSIWEYINPELLKISKRKKPSVRRVP